MGYLNKYLSKEDTWKIFTVVLYRNITIRRGRSVFIIAIKEFPSLGLQNKPLIAM